MATSNKTFVSDVAESARGQWDFILASLSIDVIKNKHTPCPICGGDDRFRYDDKDNRGSYFCNKCDPGDGIALVEKVMNVSTKEAAKQVAIVLGIDTGTPIQIDREAIKKRKKSQQQTEKKKLAEQKAATAKLAKELLDKCKQGESEYLKNKGLPPKGLISNTAINGLKPPLLTIPYYRDDELATLQFINGAGKKRFLEGKGTQQKAHHVIDGKNDVVCIGEGYATTLTPCMLKGFKGYVAGSDHNIATTALTAREQNPQAKIVILIDNNKAGLDANEKAHALLGDCIGIAPPDNATKIKDWNDYFQKYGADKTAMEIDNLIYGHETDIVPHDDSTLASQEKDEVKEIPVVKLASSNVNLEVKKVTANRKLKEYCRTLATMPVAELPEKWETEERCVEIMNESYAVSLIGGDVIIIKEGTDAHGKDGIAYLKVGSLKTWGANLSLKVKKENGSAQVNAIIAWLKHDNRMTYDGITFIPNKASDDNYYNLWRGWEVKPVVVDGYPLIQKFLAHLLDNICDSDNDHYKYLLCWIAQMFQHPEQKPEVAVVLKSDARGTGKSKIAEVLSEIIGFHTTKIAQTKHLIGQFNSHLSTAIFAHVEESFWSGNKADAGIIRDLITGREINIEGKGKDLVTIPSYHRYMLITNNDWAVPASRDERRFFVLEVAEHQKQNRPYFKALTDDLEAGGYNQLMAFLMEYSIDLDVNQAPRTKGLEDQIIESMEPEEQFWMDCLMTGLVGGGKQMHEVTTWKVSNKQLHDEYVAHMKKQGIRSRPLSILKFGKKIGKLCPKRKGGQKDDYENERQNAKEYPNLGKCRDAFIKAMGLTVIDWDE